MCNGLMVPIVTFEQIRSFDTDTLVKELSKYKKVRKDIIIHYISNHYTALCK
jgi:hypothetical protein